MPTDPTNAAESVSHAQAPEAELPQAPPGAPEGHDAAAPEGHDAAAPAGHDAAAPAGATRPQAEPEVSPEPAAPAGPSSEDDLAAKAEKADEYLALAQRTKADFENYRKRAVREAAAAQERGAVKLALALLPALDNLDRALAHADSTGESDGNGTSSLVAGIKHVQADVIAALGNVGIEPFSPEGERFDPQYHEAVAQQPVEGTRPGVVVEVFQRGYRMGESVVRPARVVVAG